MVFITDNSTNKTTKLFFMLQPKLTNLTPNALLTAAIKNTTIVTRCWYINTNYILKLRDSDVGANFKRLPANRAASQDILLLQLLKLSSARAAKYRHFRQRDSYRFQRGNAKCVFF